MDTEDGRPVGASKTGFQLYMKNFRLLSALSCAAVLSALTLSASPIQAAPPAPMNKPKPPKGRVSKRVQKAIETKLGRPLTPDQKKRLNAANKIRLDARKAADDKFLNSAAAITGLTVSTLRDLSKAPKKPAPGAPAPR
jgi:hypothetical protein